MTKWTAVRLATCLVCLSPFLVAQSVSYVYDDLGRLVAVTDPSGATAVYNYDAVGNILSIQRMSSSQLSIIQFSPKSGPAGTVVTITGTGFSSTATQDSVSFNGASGITPTSATANQLVVAIPAGTSSGPITVTSPNGSVTSTGPFTISASGMPTITNFNPVIGLPGAAVAVQGTNFDSTSANDKTKFSLTNTSVSSSTSTTVNTSVPQVAGSGHLTITTPKGKAISTQDFFIPPPGYQVADVGYTGRGAIGSSTTMSITATTTKMGMLVFDGLAGKKVSAVFSNSNISACNSSLYDPFNLAEGSTASCSTGSGFMDGEGLQTTGTYTLGFYTGGNTGSVGVQLYDATDVQASIPLSGGGVTSWVTASNTVPGQNVLLSFYGIAKRRLSMETSTGVQGNYSLLKPDGGPLGNLNAIGSYADTQVLPETGTYTILVDPSGTNTGSTNVAAWDVPPDVVAPWSLFGVGSAASISTPGQNWLMWFPGASGQHISVTLSNGTYRTCTAYVGYYVAYPGPFTQVGNSQSCTGAHYVLDAGLMPFTGNFAVLVDPQGDSTGSVAVVVNDASDYHGSIPTDGTRTTVNINVPDENAYLTFSGTAGQRVSLLSSSTGGLSGGLGLLKPDGSQLSYTSISNMMGPVTLPVSGTYTIKFTDSNATTGTLTLQLYTVPDDITGSLQISGPQFTVTTTAPGQNATLTFSGTAGQHLYVGLSAGTYPNSCNLRINKPDNSYFTSTGCGGAVNYFDAGNLSVTGTYSISITAGSGFGSVTVGLATPTNPPARASGAQLDTNNSLATNLVGLFVMNEGSGTADTNLVDANTATFAGTAVPTWNTSDPSVVFAGGNSLSSYLNAGADTAFNGLTTQKMTIVGKVYVNSLTYAGLCEKNDGNPGSSGTAGFLFGWYSWGQMEFTVEKSSGAMKLEGNSYIVPSGTWMQVAVTWDGTVGTSSAAHLFINGLEIPKYITQDGNGTIGDATSYPFRIGNASYDVAGSLNGKIAYLAVYKGRILTPTEMGQLDAQLPIR